MFYPHLAEIEIDRDEPSIDIVKASKLIRRRNSLLAERIIAKGFLKPRKGNPKISDILRARVEFDVRFQSARDFIKTWNFWREFYSDSGPMMPKTKSQLTCIENIIEMTKEHKLNLSVLIGVTHKAYAWRDMNPGYTATLSKGLEYYEAFYEDVTADVDRVEYEEDAFR